MAPRLVGLTGATLPSAPVVCHDCVWWQSRASRGAGKERWIERVESEWGAWGTVYVDEQGRTLGSIQYGPASAFPRAAELPAGPPSGDAVLVTCAYLVDSSSPWVLQSLFLAAIGEARERKVRALEAFSYRFAEGEGESVAERFLLHRTIFPRAFLSDFGFRPIRAAGRVELARLDLGGIVPVVEGPGEKALRILKEALQPARPVPQRP